MDGTLRRGNDAERDVQQSQPASQAAIPSAVVHELRTPLTAIHGYAQLLKRNPSDAAMAERAVDVILRESSRLGSLLKQLSEVAEIDAGPLNVSSNVANVADLARDVVERVGKGAASHEIVVDGEAVEARVDPRRVGQILGHLVDNAVKYTPEGGRVTIAIERRSRGVYISVADPGIGIPPEDGERVYERFSRGSNAHQAGARGLGLGLYVTREIARQTGGQVWHERADTGGTVFHVFIPDG